VADLKAVVSHGIAFLGELCYIEGLAGTGIIISNNRAYDTNGVYMQPRTMTGSLYLTPGRINHVFAATTTINSQWYSATIARAMYIPRYANA
jgi:hypothetical protein